MVLELGLHFIWLMSHPWLTQHKDMDIDTQHSLTDIENMNQDTNPDYSSHDPLHDSDDVLPCCCSLEF